MSTGSVTTNCNYSMLEFEWDEEKRVINLLKHKVDFSMAFECWQHPMIIKQDKRQSYGELRFQGLGLVKKRMMVVVFTYRGPALIRVISLRKANKREQAYYEKEIKQRKDSQIYI